MINRDWVQPWERTRSPIKWNYKLALIFLVVAIICALMSEPANAQMLTTQSKEPWSIAKCDKYFGKRAVAVYNVSLWNKQGWPLWRVICVQG